MDDKTSSSDWPPGVSKLCKFPGITNNNLNCFASSMLQVLTHTPQINNHFRENPCACINTRCLKCRMREYFDQVRNCIDTESEIDPTNFLTEVLEGNRYGLRLGSMGDPVEFYDLLEEKLGDSPEENILRRVFGCEQAQVVRCSECGREAETRQRAEVKVGSGKIQECLIRSFGGVQKGLRRTCGGCGVVTETTERNVIVDPPEVLHLKMGDLRSEVEFGEKIDIRRCLAGERNDPVVYELFAIISYWGDFGGYGHYVAYCKAPSGRWNEYNDARVSRVDIKRVLSAKPYSLFYKPSLDSSCTREYDGCVLAENETCKEVGVGVKTGSSFNRVGKRRVKTEMLTESFVDFISGTEKKKYKTRPVNESTASSSEYVKKRKIESGVLSESLVEIIKNHTSIRKNITKPINKNAENSYNNNKKRKDKSGVMPETFDIFDLYYTPKKTNTKTENSQLSVEKHKITITPNIKRIKEQRNVSSREAKVNVSDYIKTNKLQTLATKTSADKSYKPNQHNSSNPPAS